MESATQNIVQVAQEFYDSLNEDTTRMQAGDNEENNRLSAELISANSFEELGIKPELIAALYKMGVDKPSLIQRKSIPVILSGKNCAFHSKSGTGKTLGFTTGILSKVIPGNGTQVIIITPTRELNAQVGSVVSSLAAQINVGVSMAMREFSAESVGEEIVIGCPGKILTLVNNKVIRTDKISMIVLDEADHMIASRAFGAQTLKLLNILQGIQKVFFSATYSEISQNAVRKIASEGEYFFTENKKATNIKLYFMEVERKKKIETIIALFELVTVAQSIIFANSKKMVETIGSDLKNDGFKVSTIHGDIPIEERDVVFREFSNAQTKVLVSTDVFSRGIDIPQVNLIINFDLPSDHFENATETYIHRIGRSGRFNRTGFVIDFISNAEDLEKMNSLHSSIGEMPKLFTLDSLKTVVGNQ